MYTYLEHTQPSAKLFLQMHFQMQETLLLFILHHVDISLPLLSCPGPASGLNEEDLRASLATVEALASACGADVSVLRERQGEEGHAADCLVRRRVDEDDFMEVRYHIQI